MNNLEFLQQWFILNCDGNWEHNFGIKIETLDNPGWYVTVDLEDTKFENLFLNESNVDSDTDWYYIKIVEKQLIISGDVNKLIFLLNKVQQILS